MARGKTQEPETTALTKWNGILTEAAKESADLAAQQSGGGAKSIGTRAGVMTIDGNPVPGNCLVGVVAGFTLLNKYYEDEFDPDNPSSPVCYAYGLKKDEMGPHDECEKPQGESCTGCPQNEFGTANKGNGKACKNTYQLLVLPAGDYDAKTDTFDAPESADELQGDLYGLSVSPVNLKAWSGYVAKMAGNLRPPWACFTKITVQPDAKKQVSITFEPVKNADTELLQTLKERHDEAMKIIEQPFTKNSEREEPAPKSKAKRQRKF